MRFHLDHLEQIVDEVILKRGWTYYKKGLVGPLDRRANGHIRAEVSGTDAYQVDVWINDLNLTEHVCTCPYVLGPICKHTVAVLLQTRLGEISPVLPAAPKKPSSPKREPTKREPVFRRLIPIESKTEVRREIKDMLRSIPGRTKFIAWNMTGRVAMGVGIYLDDAEQFLAQEEVESAFFIATSVVEELTKAFAYADDSNGDLGGCIRQALDLLTRISQSVLTETMRVTFFKYAISTYKKELFIDWDWHLDLMEFAANVSRRETETQAVLDLLNKDAKSEWRRERAQCLILDILRKTKDEKTVSRYIQTHLNNPTIRREAIIDAMNRQLYDQAIDIANDGIRFDEKKRPGYVTDWQELLLEIAKARHDTESVIMYARLLFMNNHRHESVMYQTLKSAVGAENWETFVEELIRDHQKMHWAEVDRVARIYREEGWTRRLMDLLNKYTSLSRLLEYERILVPDYPDEMLVLYRNVLDEGLVYNKDRKTYQETAQIIRKIKKWAGPAAIADIIAGLRERYPKRPALLEELDRV